LLPGIGRAIALEKGRLSEGVLTIEDVRTADEIALISDSRGWRRAILG
jgi:para-aminobenzoate synthetase/4-amino-4-deoxychorismate lyase